MFKSWTVLIFLILNFAAILKLEAFNPTPLGYEKDVTLTVKEHEALVQFKRIIEGKLPTGSKYVNKYVQDDLYLIRWLRARQLNVKEAEKMFDDNLKWRLKEKLDTIEDEDWSDMKKDYPVFQDGVDKYGCPVTEFWYSDWPIRSGVIAGKMQRIVRWLTKLNEIQNRRLYDGRLEGLQCSRGPLLFEGEGFNLVQHFCPRCAPLYLQTVIIFEAHYPLIWDSLNMLHVPQSWELALRLMKPVMEPDTRNILKSYSRKEDVIKFLNGRIDKCERSERYGGTRVRDV